MPTGSGVAVRRLGPLFNPAAGVFIGEPTTCARRDTQSMNTNRVLGRSTPAHRPRVTGNPLKP